MKLNKAIFLLFWAALIGSFTAQAQFIVVTNVEDVTIMGYTGDGGFVEIPGTINGYPVTSIDQNAFSNCVSFTYITIPNNVTSIAAGAFYGCSNLQAIFVYPGNATFSSLDGVLFDVNQSTLIVFPGGMTRDYAIPSGIASIGDWAFAGCASLTNVVIANSVTNIGSDAFYNCAGLNQILIPSSVAGMGEEVFNKCSNITIGSPNVGVGWFSGNDSLCNLTLLDSVTNLSTEAFGGCASLTNVTFGNGLVSIEGTVFVDCTGLTSITIPNSVRSMANSVFEDCARLKEVTIGTGLGSLPWYDFSDCSSLTSVEIPNNITYIGKNVFYGCTSLTNVVIGSGTTDIDRTAFTYCPALVAISVSSNNASYCSELGVLLDHGKTTIVQFPRAFTGSYSIPNGVTSIESSAFIFCTGLTSITFPNSVTVIGDDAFYGCSSLANVDLGNGVATIGNYAFGSCTGLTNILMAANIKSIGTSVFEWCPNLARVYFTGNAPGFGEYPFYDDDTVLYYLPDTTGWADANTNAGIFAELWNPQMQTTDAHFGLQNNRFGFNITGTTNIPIVVEACTSVSNPIWVPLLNCTLTNGTVYFSDPQWTNLPNRFYRISSP